MLTAVFVVGIPLAAFIAFVLGCRRIGNAGVRIYERDMHPDGRPHPRCACYVTSAMGISEPRLIRGRTCEIYFLNEGCWPEWCHGREA
jgi:hypothetical protein